MATKRRTSKQSGGTFLGIVLGLIVGLAIAVVVALYITHAPTPFVSKGPSAASDTAASSVAPGDPNRSLQGKSPGQAVPQAVQPAPPNTAPGQTSNQSQSSGVLDEPQIVEVPGAPNVPAAPAKPSSSAAAQASNLPSPSKTTPPANPGTSDANTGYLLQVGAYKTDQDAQQQRARLALQGFEARVTQRDAGGGVTYYRVRLGPFAHFEDMNSVRQRLSDAGVDTAVIRFTKQ